MTTYDGSLDDPGLAYIRTEAVDLMSSQQAMPDERALDRLRELIRQAYELGQSEY